METHQPKTTNRATTTQPAAVPKNMQSQAAAVRNPAPSILELKGKSAVSSTDSIARWLSTQSEKKAKVPARFGKTANGTLEIERSGDSYQIPKQFLPLSHPLFQNLEKLQPGLIVYTEGENVLGYVGLSAAENLPQAKDLVKQLKSRPALLGLSGFDLPKLSGLTNKLESGDLQIGLTGIPIQLGSVFSGTFSVAANSEQVTNFEGNVTVKVTGLVSGMMALKRSSDGQVTGKAKIGVNLSKNITGEIEIEWDGQAVLGEGKVGYSGEKFSGEILLKVMDKEKAAETAQAKKGKEEKSASAKKQYLVVGEGDLQFSFTEWLAGSAHVLIDQKGHLTVVGEIAPPKEIELFPQQDYHKQLFQLEARAIYGLPVVGNIFIFGNISLHAFATLGPGKLYQIQIKGNYSTDPKKANSFTIQGSLNISAAAGLKLRGEAGTGLEILDHDLKAGGGVNGIAGIQGYVEAIPMIGYREKLDEKGGDKKGQFFIRGDMEIAAQPFLSLTGDLFVEVDSPWWSPLPDKKWTWPLGSKSWPIGGSFGISASLDYVLGSKQWPTVEFKPVNFSGDKFFSDLYSNKTQAGKGKEGKKPGEWQERNSKGAEAPTGSSKKGNAVAGPAPDLGKAKSKVQPGMIGSKKDKSKKLPGKTEKMKDSKQVEEEAKEPQKPLEDREKRWERGVAMVNQALEYAKTKGIDEKELNQILKSIRRKRHLGFKALYAKKVEGREWVIWGSMSLKKPIDKVILGQGGNDIHYPAGTSGDRVLINWYKKADDYPSVLGARPTTGFRRTVTMGGRQQVIARKVARGNFLQTRQHLTITGDANSRTAHFLKPKELDALGAKRNDQGVRPLENDSETARNYGRPTQGIFEIDHVKDLNLGGEDDVSNLWPLSHSANQAGNQTQQQQVVTRIVQDENGEWHSETRALRDGYITDKFVKVVAGSINDVQKNAITKLRDRAAKSFQGTVEDPFEIAWMKRKNDYPTFQPANSTRSYQIGEKAPVTVNTDGQYRKNTRYLKVTPANYNPEETTWQIRRNSSRGVGKSVGNSITTQFRNARNNPNQPGSQPRVTEADGTELVRLDTRTYLEADHVKDLNFGGQDEHSNMWPLPANKNNAANAVNHQYVAYKKGNENKVAPLRTARKDISSLNVKIVNRPGIPASQSDHGTTRDRPAGWAELLRQARSPRKMR